MTRPYKGKSLIAFPDNYTVIDLETTGLDTNFSDIIEIGAIKIRKNQIVESYSTLIQPPTRWYDDENNYYYLDEFITNLTGITNA